MAVKAIIMSKTPFQPIGCKNYERWMPAWKIVFSELMMEERDEILLSAHNF